MQDGDLNNLRHKSHPRNSHEQKTNSWTSLLRTFLKNFRQINGQKIQQYLSLYKTNKQYSLPQIMYIRSDMFSLYTTNSLIQTLRLVKILGDQKISWRLHYFFTNKDKKFIVLLTHHPRRSRFKRTIVTILHSDKNHLNVIFIFQKACQLRSYHMALASQSSFIYSSLFFLSSLLSFSSFLVKIVEWVVNFSYVVFDPYFFIVIFLSFLYIIFLIPSLKNNLVGDRAS